MNLRKLPPSMLLTLGLACGDGKSSDDTTTVTACLSPMPSTETMGPCLDIGPCLSETGFTTNESTSSGTSGSGSSGSSGADSTFGPCLSPEPPETTSDTGSGTDTGSDTGTDTDGTTGMMGDEPPSRAAALERVLGRGALPADVAARLRGTVR